MSDPPDTPRNRKLLEIYNTVRELGIGTPVYYEALRSGMAFKAKYPLFKDYTVDHKDFISKHPKFNLQPSDHIYRIQPQLANRITEFSCKLEGNTLTEPELSAFLPTIEPPTPNPSALSLPLIPKSTKHTAAEYNEAYFHFVALYYAQGLFAQRVIQRKPIRQLLVKPQDLMNIHSILMYPFPQHTPGVFRRVPIHVSSHDLAVFPYPPELPTLVSELCEWTSRSVSAHPILFASDLFLNFCHLHPFDDGNGRLGRILFTMALVNSGYRPIVFSHLERSKYLQVVYEAQQNGHREVFYELVLDELLRQRKNHRTAHKPAAVPS